MADPATSVLSSAIEAATSAAATTTAADDMVPPCDAGNEYNGEIGLRVSAIFVILVGSMLGMSSSISPPSDLTTLARPHLPTTPRPSSLHGVTQN